MDRLDDLMCWCWYTKVHHSSLFTRSRCTFPASFWCTPRLFSRVAVWYHDWQVDTTLWLPPADMGVAQPNPAEWGHLSEGIKKLT